MTRARRRAAFSAVAMSVGLSGVVLFAVAPFAGSSAAGATVRTMVIEPSQVEGCDVDPAGPCEEPTPVVTVTVTEDPEVPQETVTTTITVPASPKPKPTKTTAAPPPPPETAVAPPPVQEPPPVVPTAGANTPENTENSEPQFPQTTPDPNQQLPAADPTPSDTAMLDQSSSGTSVYEIRNAGSEFDGATLSRQLGIPALILVLLVLFAVLIFEGRLRRMAHAAAIRRAGPRGMDPMAYPGGPGYAAAGPYQGGTAYAPIISFVPMQMYAPVYPEGYTPEQYPHGYDQTTAYMPAPGHEQPPATGHGAPYDPRTGQVYPVPPGQSPYGPTLQEGPTLQDGPAPQGGAAAFQGTPHPGQDSREGRLPQGAPEFPGAPFPQEPARSRPGDDPLDDLRPAVTDDAPGQVPSQDRPLKDGIPPSGREPQGDLGGSKGEVMTFGPQPQDGPGEARPGGDQPPAGPGSTAIYPIPGRETGKSSDKDSGKGSGKKKRGLFRRST
ncbi:hypothetical protein ABT352_28115 [Streptosporangium sp. NPDC000563]|uniref:hypothetical protein n=1 Tax=Streptosporangium sp. NPDC000563 TaxID=3154366 RepID=UPI00332D259E